MKIFDEIASTCSRCGVCLRQQRAEGMPAQMCGDLAEQLASVQDISEVSAEAYQFLLSCSACDNCTAFCPQHLSCAQLVRAGRARLLELQPQLLYAYRSLRVDYQENLYALLRKALGIVYEDALTLRKKDVLSIEEAERAPQGAGKAADPTETAATTTLFFPGCALASYSEEITKKVYENLRKEGLVQGMSVYCCGKPLEDMGASEAYERYAKSLIKRLKERGVSHLITACPNCYYSLSRLLRTQEVNDLTLTPLPVVLSELDVSCTGCKYESVVVHDSCPDRFERSFGTAVRTLLGMGKMKIRAMENNGIDTLCCGVGGLSAYGDPRLSRKRQERRVTQFEDTGAECLVCYCVNCANAFASNERVPKTTYYLETLSGATIDWEAVGRAYNKVLAEDARALLLPLEESTKIFDD